MQTNAAFLPEEVELLALDECIDFANKTHEEIGKHHINTMLAPKQTQFKELCVPALEWQSIKYGSDVVDQVPDNKCGVYTFVLREKSSILPPYHYMLYVLDVCAKWKDDILLARYRREVGDNTIDLPKRVS